MAPYNSRKVKKTELEKVMKTELEEVMKTKLEKVKKTELEKVMKTKLGIKDFCEMSNMASGCCRTLSWLQ